MKRHIFYISATGLFLLFILLTNCKKEEVPVVTLKTYEATEITGSSATVEGEILSSEGTSILKRGVCISEKKNPTPVDGQVLSSSTSNKFTVEISNLKPNTKFYYRAFAMCSSGIFYGSEMSFTTTKNIPIVLTNEVTDVVDNTAVCGGEVLDDGGETVTSRGVCWSSSEYPTINDSKTINGQGLGSFTSSITNLSHSTTYYVRAYAVNSLGVGYGNQQSFSTGTLIPTVTTKDITSITLNTAVSGGNVISDGGLPVTSRGVCWGTINPPYISGSHTSNGSGVGSFNSNISGLSMGQKYYVRAYAVNSKGTAYGEVKEFTTEITAATITTSAIESITNTTAFSGGNVISDGGSTVTTRGVCWNTQNNPTINDYKKESGSGTGAFVTYITNLTLGTNYYLRAYAINDAGVSYGEELTFMTHLTGTTGTLVDVEGNTYNWVGIGTQVWMKENLQTTKYNDGTSIPLVTDNNSWINLSTPGYCWYNNDEATFRDRGALYNWYVVETNKVCPAGWHVPSREEFKVLYNYVSPEGYECKWANVLKSTSGWPEGANGTDNVGFNAKPAGYRWYYTGAFNYYQSEVNWWSTTQKPSEDNYAYFGEITSSYSMFSTDGNFFKTEGYSIRCVRN
ncbi:MAG TPA: FISUMP domain-containing protein [Tenuifilaceae bacterium]|nr:FISUMP domain-containing protein [Tenuifilaceae bacterium]